MLFCSSTTSKCSFRPVIRAALSATPHATSASFSSPLAHNTLPRFPYTATASTNSPDRCADGGSANKRSTAAADRNGRWEVEGARLRGAERKGGGWMGAGCGGDGGGRGCCFDWVRVGLVGAGGVGGVGCLGVAVTRTLVEVDEVDEAGFVDFLDELDPLAGGCAVDSTSDCSASSAWMDA